MTRGIRPVAGIAEAKRMATVWGFTLIEIGMVAPMPFDFGIHENGSTSLVRVRRLKHNAYRPESISTSCVEQIRELRCLALPEGVGRELWVRGPERAWHRYRVLPDTVEEIIRTSSQVPPAGKPGSVLGVRPGQPGQEQEAE